MCQITGGWRAKLFRAGPLHVSHVKAAAPTALGQNGLDGDLATELNKILFRGNPISIIKDRTHFAFL